MPSLASSGPSWAESLLTSCHGGGGKHHQTSFLDIHANEIRSFYINLPVGGLSVALIIFLFTTPKAAKPQEATLREKFLQLDLPGTFLLMAAVICLILVFQWGGVTRAWDDADVIGLLVGAGLITILFIALEIRMGERALLLPRIIKQKTIALMCLFQAFNSGAFLTLLYYLPIYFQVVSGVSAADSGIRNLPYILGICKSHKIPTPCHDSHH